MLCVRCSHPLPTGGDRCVRCFALNPRSRETSTGAPSISSGPPPAPLSVALESDPPPGPLSVDIDSDPPPARPGGDLDLASELDAEAGFALAPPITSPRLRPVKRAEGVPGEELGDIELGNLDLTGPFPVQPEDPGATLPLGAKVLPPVPLGSAWRDGSTPPPPFAPAVREPPAPILSMTLDEEPPAPLRPPRARAAPRGPWAPLPLRLVAWATDAALLAICATLHVLIAAEVVGPARLAPPGFASADHWLDLVAGRDLPPLWAGLAACLALAYSWLFAAVGGRTPGMALAGLKLVRVSGKPLSPLAALGRAVLSLLSAAPALFGFALCLFDPRGQALHDKLTGTAVVRDDGDDAALAPPASVP